MRTYPIGESFTWLPVLVPLLAALVGCADSDPAAPGDPPDVPLAETAQASEDELVAIHLGTLGGDSTMALDISDDGHVVGWSHGSTGATRPFIWTAEEGMRDLGTLGGEGGVAMAVNAKGTVVGWSHDPEGRMLATKWDAGGEAEALDGHVSIDPETHPSVATAINHAGETVGWTHGAFLARWAPDGSALGMDGCPGGFPSDISDGGTVVGIASAVVGAFLADGVSEIGGILEYSGFVWSSGGEGCQGLIDEAFVTHEVVAINRRGTIVGLGGEWEEYDPPMLGLIRLTSIRRPFTYTRRTGFQVDPDLPANPRDINGRGTIVGDGIEAINERGDRVGGEYLWTATPKAFSSARPVAALAPPSPPGALDAQAPATAPTASSGERSACPSSLEHLVTIGALPECPVNAQRSGTR